jgi:hypothetical protein
MNKVLVDAIVVVMLLLLFLMTVLYIITPDPAGTPSVSLIINGSLGVVIILTVALIGMVIND